MFESSPTVIYSGGMEVCKYEVTSVFVVYLYKLLIKHTFCNFIICWIYPIVGDGISTFYFYLL